MESGELYSAYELDASFEDLEELCNMGILHKQGIKDGPFTFMRYKLEA